jgi:carbon starvation protein CstA
LEQQTMPVEVLQHRPLQQSVLVVQVAFPGRHAGVVVVLVVVVLVVVVLVVVVLVVVVGGVQQPWETQQVWPGGQQAV